MANDAASRRQSYLLATSSLAAVKGRPVRIYTSGSAARQCCLAVTSDDKEVVGFAAGSMATADRPVAVTTEVGAPILAYVITTVAQGAKLRAGAGGTLRSAGSTSGNPYIAVATQARTNQGEVWVAYTPGEVD